VPEDGAFAERSLLSDRERPQFLPPEDPPPEPSSPPLVPGLSEGSPVRSGLARPNRLALLVAAAGVAVLLTGLLLFSNGGGPSPAARTPRPAAGPEFAALPDPCAAVGPALPADVAPVRPRRFENSCTWQLLRTSRSRSLEVDLRLERTVAGQGTSGTVEAARDFADDLAYTADRGRNGGFESDPEHLGGLGDEAFAAQASNLVVAGVTERTTRSYDMGGAQVEARSRNVVVTVKWRGADYPPGARKHSKLVGTRFTYPDARRQAVLVAGTLLSRLG
jgi:hypothetical protein